MEIVVVSALVLAVLTAILMWPLLWAWRFALLYPPREKGDRDNHALPCAAVILCLRGADPTLPGCLRGILEQDYPDYQVWIIIDSQDDPAWESVQAFLGERAPGRVACHVQPLELRRSTCSLKLSSQLQAITQLDNSVRVVALIDADVIPARDWLRSLAVPLLDLGVGASTGVRWYTPQGARWGTLVRYIWNAAALTQMHAFGIPWGGSLAFRTQVLREAGLLEQWAHSFCEDTSSRRLLGASGLSVQTVPAATVLSQEITDLRGCYSFLRRQLLCARLYLPAWSFVLGVNCTWGLALFGTLLFPLAWAAGQEFMAVGLGAVLGLFLLGMLAALVRVERHIRRLARARSENVPAYTLSWKFLPAIPLALVLHLAGLIEAHWMRRVAWRGIVYELEAKGAVRLTEYRPYQPSPQRSGQERSVL
jgi:cellulose synthase/poly-beta-1,6-N-acetylglucosamine synthase-like glycosyltransferase